MAIRHKRDPDSRRKHKAALLAGPIALVVTGTAVAAGVLASDPEPSAAITTSASSDAAASSILQSRRETVSRADSRLDAARLQRALDAHQAREARAATLKAIRQADTKLWTTAPLYLWTAPGKKAKNVGLVDRYKRVLVTGRRTPARTELVVGGKARWVKAGYLSVKNPTPPPAPAPAPASSSSSGSSGSSGSSSSAAAAPAPAPAGCNNGTSVSSGVSPNIVKVHEAVCAAFPEITTYGTFRGDGEHAQGIAVDIMVSGSRGQEVAEFVRANYSSLGVNYLIYAQQIWSVDRAGEGWRGMEDRGSTTANHYDHVHVTTY